MLYFIHLQENCFVNFFKDLIIKGKKDIFYCCTRQRVATLCLCILKFNEESEYRSSSRKSLFVYLLFLDYESSQRIEEEKRLT